MGHLTGHGSVSGGGIGAAPVLATAALLGDSDGRFTLAESLLTQVARRARRGDGPLDTVLVAQEASYALLLRLPPEFHLVGVIAEREMGFVPPADGVAIVSGVAGALSTIQDGDWVIVDPERGRVVVNPAAEEIARLQKGRTRRPRFLLGAAHTPARTLSGRTIAVWAAAGSLPDVEAALRNGADGILIDEGSALLADAASDDPDADERLFSLLAEAADIMGGCEVCIAAGMDVVHPRTIVRLAARCRLSWAVRPEELPYPLPELAAEMNRLIEQEEDEGGAAALPRIDVLVEESPADGGADETALIGFSEALWSAEAPLPVSFGFLPPTVRVVLPEPLAPEALEQAVRLGASGVAVAPPRVESVKDAIRQLEL